MIGGLYVYEYLINMCVRVVCGVEFIEIFESKEKSELESEFWRIWELIRVSNSLPQKVLEGLLCIEISFGKFSCVVEMVELSFSWLQSRV